MTLDYWFLESSGVDVKAWNIVQLLPQLVRTELHNLEVLEHRTVHIDSIKSINSLNIEVNLTLHSDAVYSLL